jgi:radical SAM superfamily enzyme with C-terminal helix-hairpin-helix motif
VPLLTTFLHRSRFGGSAGGPKSSSSVKLVTVAADGAKVVGGTPAFGDQVTYEVATTPTIEPYVETSCSQNGKLGDAGGRKAAPSFRGRSARE